MWDHVTAFEKIV